MNAELGIGWRGEFAFESFYGAYTRGYRNGVAPLEVYRDAALERLRESIADGSALLAARWARTLVRLLREVSP